MIKRASLSDLKKGALAEFDRYQNVKKCWRKENDKWLLKDIAFVEQWNEEEKDHIVTELSDTVKNGGAVFLWLEGESIMGFASVENSFFGKTAKYVQLPEMMVSYGKRGSGIGKVLFNECVGFAKLIGAEKMYISGHSSEETQAFYRAMGCVETKEINIELYNKEPCDVHLEFVL